MGTWALPNTTEKAEYLFKLIQNPLKVKGLENKLYDYFGDDELFDDIAEVRNEFGSKYDYRPEIKSFIENLLKNYENYPDTFYVAFSNHAIEILKSIIQK